MSTPQSYADNKTTTIDIALDVDFGGMAPEEAAKVTAEIKKAVSMGRPHIKVLWRCDSYTSDPATKSRKVQVTTETFGCTTIGGSIVAAMGTFAKLWDVK